ncbi:MAG: thiamine diphosphokinase [Candidatus Cloacimonadota bacterium]|nr:MAG: thiamine diphosphokinase [Candidatus Cloacimonadota bacterium]RLC51528.1 MAG: thiamine diphosphokinase [Candidatus Cloacimonadota bacterium]
MRGLDKIIIIANGELPSEEIMKSLKLDKDMIIAADGGARICRECGLVPYYIVGDLDSIKDEIGEFKHSEIVKIESQDTTDMQKALDFAIQFHPEELHIYAALGNRCDHTLANLFLFFNFEYNGDLTVYDNFGCLKILKPGKHKLEGESGELVSFFSFSKLKNFKIKGLKYPVPLQNLKSNFYSISNEFTSANAEISFSEGRVLYYRVCMNRAK